MIVVEEVDESQVVDEWILSDDTILVHIFILDLHL